MITRSGILREVLEEKGRQLMKYSKHGACLLPVEGYEKLFEDLNEECRLLRGMIIENETREQQAGVKPAQWQKDLMDGKEPDMSWTGAQAEKAEEEIPPEGKEYVWNPETKTWDDPLEAPRMKKFHDGKWYEWDPEARLWRVTYPGGE